MAEAPQKGMVVAPGFDAAEESPSADALYMSVEQFQELYCMEVTEAQVRFAMDLMHSVVNRPSLWPETYTERLEVPEDQNQVIVSARPVVSLVKCEGRYGTGRRHLRSGATGGYDLMMVTSFFGQPPGWTVMDVNTLEVQGGTGEIWLSTGPYLAQYTEVQVTYLAGLLRPSSRIKAALVEIVNTVREKGVSDRTRYWVGRVQREYAAPGFITDTAKNLLEPYIRRGLV